MTISCNDNYNPKIEQNNLKDSIALVEHIKDSMLKDYHQSFINVDLNANDSLKSLYFKSLQYFGDSILKGKTELIKYYLNNYSHKSCQKMIYSNKRLKDEFEGINPLEDIDGDEIKDTVFVISDFDACSLNAESYCFFNKKLPPLFTDSECCYPNNLFVVEDFNEDGRKEIGIFYSTCTSRFKSLIIYSLNKNQWKEIGSSTFDVLTQDPTKVEFKSLVKKISKNKFKICNFEQGKSYWEIIKM